MLLLSTALWDEGRGSFFWCISNATLAILEESGFLIYSVRLFLGMKAPPLINYTSSCDSSACSIHCDVTPYRLSYTLFVGFLLCAFLWRQHLHCPPLPTSTQEFSVPTGNPTASCWSGPGWRVHLLGNRGGKCKLLIQDRFLQSVGRLGSAEQSIQDGRALAPAHVLPFQPAVVSVLGNRRQDGVGLDLRTHLLRGCHWGNEKARQLQTAQSEGWGLRAAPSATLEPGPWNHSVCACRWRDLEALPTAWDNNPHRSSCPGPSWKPCLDRACPLSLASNPKFPGRMFCPFSRSLPLPEPRAAPPSPKNALSEAADPAHNVASPREVTY